MVMTTLPFGTRSFQANHVPTTTAEVEAHSTSRFPSHVAIRAVRAATLLTMVLVGAACGGGSDSADAAPPAAGVMEPIAAETAAPETTTAQAVWQTCVRVPAAASLLALGDARRDVRSFGAKPNDNVDDTDEIQKALDTLKAGETLWFPSGRYLMNRSLLVRRPGITISGEGATLHATNPDDLSLIIQADDTTVASLTFTAITSGRRNATRHARISVSGDLPGGYRRIRNSVIRDNRIVNADDPGTPGANSASTAGILVLHAERFLVAGNTVARTLADGIHITGGSRNGRVLNNVVRETGDDMIAVVSYADSVAPAKNTAARLSSVWEANVERRLNRNLLISGNKLSGQYSGRGISVVGGQSIAIVRNTLENIPVAAGILLAREATYQSFGVENVVVEGNIVREVQTKAPPYDGANKYAAGKRTGHGAIEVHAALFDDEAADPQLRSLLAVRNVVVRGNTVERSAVSAVRAGVPMNQTMRDGSDSRHFGNGVIENISVQGNRFEDVNGEAINVLGQDLKETGLHCNANQRDGRDYRSSACKAAEPILKGLPLTCSADGRLL